MTTHAELRAQAAAPTCTFAVSWAPSEPRLCAAPAEWRYPLTAGGYAYQCEEHAMALPARTLYAEHLFHGTWFPPR